MTNIMERLQAIAFDKPPHLPGFTGQAALGGRWQGLHFIATEDHDGHIELSLSKPDGTRVASKRARSFFRFLDIEPDSGRLDQGATAHWVVQRGAKQ